MNLRRLLLNSAILLSTVTVPSLLVAESVGPGVFHGYFDETRWGDLVFHTGPYHVFLSPSVAEKLADTKSKPISLNVKRWVPSTSYDTKLIAEILFFEFACEVSRGQNGKGLVLQAQLQQPQVKEGEGINLTLSLENKTDKPIPIFPSSFAIAFATNSPFKDEDINYDRGDSRYCYWAQSSILNSPLWSKNVARVACHEVRIPWTAPLLIEKGMGISPLDEEKFSDNSRVVIKPGGTFAATFTAGNELLPDDYEVFFYIARGNFSHIAGPRSDRIAFDVLP